MFLAVETIGADSKVRKGKPSALPYTDIRIGGQASLPTKTLNY